MARAWSMGRFLTNRLLVCLDQRLPKGEYAQKVRGQDKFKIKINLTA